MAPVVRIPNLKQIASSCVAIALWKHIDLPAFMWIDYNEEFDDSPLIDHVYRSMEKLVVPRCIAKLLKTYAQKVKKELEDWVRYLSNKVLRNNGQKNELYCDINDIIWYSDGTINHKATARNLLNSLRLSEIEKYHVLCHYCLKDDIDRLSPLLFTNNIVDHVDFISDPSIYYWNCYFRKELHKIPARRDLSLDVYMFRQEDVDWWFAKEYFFDRLNPEQQVENVLWSIDESGAYYILKQLLMKLNEDQLLHVYIARAEQIIDMLMILDDYYQEILPTWYDIRDWINQDQFAAIFMNLIDSLMHGGVPGVILTEIWTSAGDDFRSFILNYQDHIIFERIVYWWKRTKDNSFLDTLLQHVNANLKQEITSRTFFRKFCEDLISALELTKLECLLSTWCSFGDELIQFKRNFTETEFFIHSCESMLLNIIYVGKDDFLLKLEHLWNIWFSSVEEVTIFKRDFTRKNVFRYCCVSMMLNRKLPTLESLLNLCLLGDGEFERDFAQDEILFDHCEELIDKEELHNLEQLLKICFCNADALIEFQNHIIKREFFLRYCKKSIEHDDKFKVMERLLNCCVSNTEEGTIFKQNLVIDLIKDRIYSHCPKWKSRKEQMLPKWLTLFLPSTSESIRFMRDLVFNSPNVRNYCLNGSWFGHLNTMNDTLNEILLSQSNLVLEYKKDLWSSSIGFLYLARIFRRQGSRAVNEIIADSFSDTNSANELRKKLIFLPEIIDQLQQMVLDGQALNILKNQIEEFLPLNEDQRTLKRHLIDNLQPKLTDIFYKYGDSGWQSLMQQYLEDEKVIQELKLNLMIDDIFERAFKECIFQTYDEHHRVSRCTLKKNFVFDSLDRVLNWYFESPKKTKEYKVQKIYSYENIKTIDTLLKKNCHSSYMTELMNWFFENDSVEIAKFKKKHEGEQFVNLIKIRRESYFKNRRTL
ncbi:uncharacterized protein LOC135836441 [Planococcus citri]|uniref:uncharacterized protein LOC135836441 n=1 Tax=Planococcus citri TaxID=170843 RepID=UPI0031F7F026